jgi:invasion protein IalB
MAQAIKNFITATTTVSMVLAISAFAQIAMTSSANAQKPPEQKWFKICAKQAESDVCNVQYRVVASSGQIITSVNLFTVTGKINRRIFQVTVPTFRLIPAGVAVKIDAQKENRIPYMHCFRELCTAEIKMDDNLIKLLKSGGEMVLTSTNYQNKANPIKVSLEGFTAAFDGPSIQRSELDKENAALQKQLEKRAKEAREALEKAQNKATE